MSKDFRGAKDFLCRNQAHVRPVIYNNLESLRGVGCHRVSAHLL